MSAIFGVMARKGELPVKFASLMRDALADWVRDDESIWTDGRVALGNLQLCCERRNMVRQPLESENLVVTVDARLDERNNLEKDLGEYSPHDAGLILACYRRWKQHWAGKVLGDFAAAVYDKSEKSIALARDYIGVCPLFYHLTPDLFCFSSDPRALLALPTVSDQLCLRNVTHQVFETRRLVTNGETIYPSLKRLLPGHRLFVTENSAILERYWSPSSRADSTHTVDEAAQQLRDLLESAVETRLGDFSLACHLSGGLDSSAVTTLAGRTCQKLGRQLPVAFSWSPPPSGTKQDEQGKVEFVARQTYDMSVVYAPFSLDSLKQAFGLHPSLGQKLCLVSELELRGRMGARRVLLSGWGGDQAASFDGCGYLAELFLSGRWVSMLRECLLLARRVNRPPGQVLKNWVVRPLIPRQILAIIGKRHHPLRAPVLRHYGVKNLNQILPDLEAVSRGYGENWLGSRSTIERRYSNFLYPLIQYRLESWALLGGRSGYRYRYPLLDRRIVEYALSLPGHHFLFQGVRRRLFRAATRGVLPDPVRRNRDKSEPGGISHAEQILTAFLQADFVAEDPVARATITYLTAGWLQP